MVLEENKDLAQKINDFLEEKSKVFGLYVIIS